MSKVNPDATRTFSDAHEKSVCKALGARQMSNSGAGHFNKGDCTTEQFLIECKTVMSPKQSVSIKKDWIEKNKQEAFGMRKPYQTVCFNFEPNGKNYYIINEGLMKFLVEKLLEEDC